MLEENPYLRKVADEFSIDALNVNDKIRNMLGGQKEEKKSRPQKSLL